MRRLGARDRRGGARGADPPLAQAGRLDQPGPGLPVLAAADQVEHRAVVGRPDRRGAAVARRHAGPGARTGSHGGATISARRSRAISRRASRCAERAEEEKEAARQAEIKRQQELAEAAGKLADEQRRRARIALWLEAWPAPQPLSPWCSQSSPDTRPYGARPGSRKGGTSEAQKALTAGRIWRESRPGRRKSAAL